MNITINKKNLLIIIGTAITIIVIIIYQFQNLNTTSDTYFETDNSIINPSSSAYSQETIDNASQIVVHIDGCVINPGIINAPIGSRITDIIDLAGGVTADANLLNINLAYKVSDEQKIHIPSITEEVVAAPNELSNNIVNGLDSTDSKKININKASSVELETLPGIGTSTAVKILNYRGEQGPFENIEEIKNVNGIGEAKFNAIKDLITVN